MLWQWKEKTLLFKKTERNLQKLKTVSVEVNQLAKKIDTFFAKIDMYDKQRDCPKKDNLIIDTQLEELIRGSQRDDTISMKRSLFGHKKKKQTSIAGSIANKINNSMQLVATNHTETINLIATKAQQIKLMQEKQYNELCKMQNMLVQKLDALINEQEKNTNAPINNYSFAFIYNAIDDVMQKLNEYDTIFEVPKQLEQRLKNQVVVAQNIMKEVKSIRLAIIEKMATMNTQIQLINKKLDTSYKPEKKQPSNQATNKYVQFLKRHRFWVGSTVTLVSIILYVYMFSEVF